MTFLQRPGLFLAILAVAFGGVLFVLGALFLLE